MRHGAKVLLHLSRKQSILPQKCTFLFYCKTTFAVFQQFFCFTTKRLLHLPRLHYQHNNLISNITHLFLGLEPSKTQQSPHFVKVTNQLISSFYALMTHEIFFCLTLYKGHSIIVWIELHSLSMSINRPHPMLGATFSLPCNAESSMVWSHHLSHNPSLLLLHHRNICFLVP